MKAFYLFISKRYYICVLTWVEFYMNIGNFQIVNVRLLLLIFVTCMIRFHFTVYRSGRHFLFQKGERNLPEPRYLALENYNKTCEEWGTMPTNNITLIHYRETLWPLRVDSAWRIFNFTFVFVNVLVKFCIAVSARWEELIYLMDVLYRLRIEKFLISGSWEVDERMWSEYDEEMPPYQEFVGRLV